MKDSLTKIEAAMDRVRAVRSALSIYDKRPGTAGYDAAHHKMLSQSLIRANEEYMALLTEFLKTPTIKSQISKDIQ